MSGYSEEYCDVYREEWRKARKPHGCHACGEPILQGAAYHSTFTVFEGQADTTKRCVRCQTMYEHLCKRIKGPRPNDSEDERDDNFVDPLLNCGHEYKDRWKEEPPPEIAALAFWLPSDGPPKIREAGR